MRTASAISPRSQTPRFACTLYIALHVHCTSLCMYIVHRFACTLYIALHARLHPSPPPATPNTFFLDVDFLVSCFSRSRLSDFVFLSLSTFWFRFAIDDDFVFSICVRGVDFVVCGTAGRCYILAKATRRQLLLDPYESISASFFTR